MSQTVITLAFEQHLAELQMGGQPVIPDEFVLANIPELDLTTPIDRAAGLPSAGQIVHRQLVDQRGKVNANGVAYSIIMDTRIGDFTFNAMYLLHKASGLVAMVVHKESEDKLKNQGVTQPGNSVVKSMLMEYQGAAEATNTTIDASTWQIDFSSRLLGLDRDIQQQAHDHYGDAAFMSDSLLVSAGTGVNEFIVAAGHGYIAGLRAELEQPHSIVVASRPATLYADVYNAGTLLSDWNTILTIKASAAPLVDYIDSSGYQHYVTPLAQLASNGAVTDLRGRGGLWWHEQRPQAHTKEQVGLDKLENWSWSHSYTDATGGAGKYASGKAVADAYNALNSAKLDKTGTAANAAKLNGQLASYYLEWNNLTGKPATFPPSSHAHSWNSITGKPATFPPSGHNHDAQYLGKTAKAVDSDKLDGQHGSYYRDWDNLTGKPATATRWPTKAELSLGSVANYTVTSSVSDPSNSKYATAGAVKKAYDRASSAISSAANNKVYSGTNAAQTSFPIGHTLTAWAGSKHRIENANDTATIYLISKPASYSVYSSSWYPSVQGAALAGTWAYRGFTGSPHNVQAGIFQRIA